GILQANSKTLVLLPTRADTDHLIYLADQKTYDTYIDKTFDKAGKEERDLMKKCAVYSGVRTHGCDTVINMGVTGGTPENRGVFAFAKHCMYLAASHKAKAWLTEGFAAYCENATLNSNQNFTIEYELNPTIKLSTASWSAE